MNKNLIKEFKGLTAINKDICDTISKKVGLTSGSVRTMFYKYKNHSSKPVSKSRPVAKLIRTINATPTSMTNVFINDIKVAIPGRAITINGNKLEW